MLKLRIQRGSRVSKALRAGTLGATFHKGKGEHPDTIILDYRDDTPVRVGVQRPGDPPRSAFPFSVGVLSDGGLYIRQPGAIRLKAEILTQEQGSPFTDKRILRDVQSIVIYSDPRG